MTLSPGSLDRLMVSISQEIGRSYPENESASMARLVLEHLGISRSTILHNPGHVPETGLMRQINEIVGEIHTGRPIQYILGFTRFCELEIRLNESVFIPRPETEEMVYRITGLADAHFDWNGRLSGWNCERSGRAAQFPERIIDLGTGSGCIALALKKHFPDALVTALDASSEALETARENGSLHGLDVSWIQGKIEDFHMHAERGPFHLIVSNPPYVLLSERSHMAPHVEGFEPEEALFVSDEDPLVHYQSIARFGRKYLDEQGAVWVEINERFGDEVVHIFRNAGMERVTLFKDIHGKERFIRACR